MANPSNTLSANTRARASQVMQNFNDVRGGQILGYAQDTDGQSSGTFGSYVDITNLSVTVTVPDSTRYTRIIAYCPNLGSGGVAGTQLQMAIRESTTVLSLAFFKQAAAGYGQHLIAIYTALVSAGSHTFKVSVQASASGFDFAADATYPAFISAELL